MPNEFVTSDNHVAVTRRRWTDEERRVLAASYVDPDVSIEEIASRLGRTSPGIDLAARRAGLVRPAASSPQGNLLRLLEDEPVAAYWMGFLFADGHFSETRMVVTLKGGDFGHLDRLRTWLGPRFLAPRFNARGQCTVSCQDRVGVGAIRERFGVESTKTYRPPASLPYEDRTLLRCFLVGFVDGDGSIIRQTGRRASALSTVSHISWRPFIEALSEGAEFGYVKTRPDGKYAGIHSSRHSEIAGLKRFATAAGLPLMGRKWDRVDLDHVPRDGATSERVRAALAAGLRPCDAARLVGCSPGLASRIRMKMREGNADAERVSIV